MKLEMLTAGKESASRSTGVVFVHGAWHGAWCWQDTFLPRFVQAGYAVYSLSLRGHGQSDGGGSLRWTRVADYVEDLAAVTADLSVPPVLVGHSMGGLVVQKYLERRPAAAGVLLASVPPRGVIGGVLHAVRRHPVAFLKANLTMSLYHLVATPDMARHRLFSESTPEEIVAACHPRLQDESYLAFLDMLLLDLPRPKRVKTPMLVLGAAEDTIVSRKDVEATARAYGTKPVIFANMGHNMMMEPGWENVADTILQWLDGRGL